MTGIIRFGRTAVGWRRTSTVDVPASGSPTPPPPPTTLSSLTLSATTFTYGIPTSGTIIGATGGSTIVGSAMPAGLAINSAARTWTWDGTGSGTSGSLVLTETLSGVSNPSTIPYTIIVRSLNALTFSATTFTAGVVGTGTIIGATAGSAISAAGLPTGLTVNSAARTWAWDGTGTAGAGSFTLTETLAGYINSPRASTISYTISGASTAPSNTTAPTLSGIPRENSTAWIGAGAWSPAPNAYRYTLKRDGVTVSGYPVVQAGDALALTWATADVGHAPDATTVEASADGGTTWSAPATVQIDYPFPSDLITPATIAAPTIVRTSASGDVVLIYRIDAPALYNSYVIRQQRYTHAGAFVEQNYIAVSEGGLGSLTINTSSPVDPAPFPAPLGTLATDDVVKVSIQSADYNQDGSVVVSGVTSPTTDVNVSDVVSAMTWSVTDNAVPGGGTALVLSNGNLTVTDSTGGVSGIRANRAVAFDKTYWEVSGNTAPIIIGAADSAAALTTGWGATADGQTPTTHAVSNGNLNGGIISYNGTRTASGIRTSTDIGCIALDRIALKAWFGHITGGVTTWYNGSPSAGTGGENITGIGTMYPAAQLVNGNVAILNPGTTPGGTAGFTGTVPTGFVAP